MTSSQKEQHYSKCSNP